MVFVVTKSGTIVGQCGGTLVASKYVVTAAHCAAPEHPNLADAVVVREKFNLKN